MPLRVVTVSHIQEIQGEILTCSTMSVMVCVCSVGTASRDGGHAIHACRLCDWSVAVPSQPLNVPVLLPQDGNLIPEKHRVQPHLRVQQGHEAQPAAESVHAGLALSEVVRVGPLRRLGALGGGDTEMVDGLEHVWQASGQTTRRWSQQPKAGNDRSRNMYLCVCV